jgi:glycosyltransferase involved in cell wall biosynthesis
MVPKVSICTITYNHQQYIADALDSFLQQRTNFPFEIVIGDDGSKDDTERICRDYASRYPGIIRYHRREPNMGMMPNMIQTMEECEGKYIAICEGDDFWTDPEKLQLQYDFMEAHPGHSLCCHLHSVLTKGKLMPMHKELNADEKDVTTEEYMMQPFFHTTSYFFRRDAMPKPFPDWYRNVLAGDHFLVLLLSLKGKIGCLNRRMSVFRNHGRSVSFTRTALDLKENFVHHLRIFDEYTYLRFHDTLKKVIRKWNFLYKVYEHVSYWKKLGYFMRNTGYYTNNFSYLGGFRTMVKFVVPYWIVNLRSKRFERSLLSILFNPWERK